MPLLDSNIIIYAHQPGHMFLDAWLFHSDTRVSAISIPEVLGYPAITDQDEKLLSGWFESIGVLAITDGILFRAAQLRRRRRMTLGDAIIAATALVHDLELITRNVVDFQHVQDLRLHNPFEADT